jgi:hypothetical protein
MLRKQTLAILLLAAPAFAAQAQVSNVIPRRDSQTGEILDLHVRFSRRRNGSGGARRTVDPLPLIRHPAHPAPLPNFQDGTTLRINNTFYWYGAGYGPCVECGGKNGCCSLAVGACGFQLNHTVNLATSTDLVVRVGARARPTPARFRRTPSLPPPPNADLDFPRQRAAR